MDLQKAKEHLFDEGRFFGGMRRRKAVKTLFESCNPEAAMVLAEAVENNHPDAEGILIKLLSLQREQLPEMHAALWQYWKKKRYAALRKAVAVSDRLRKSLAEALELMPKDDDGNETIFALWRLLEDDSLAAIISRQRRHAPGLEMDTLFGLVSGEVDRYLLLEDPDGSIFEKACLMASDGQKRRINNTILKSQNSRLISTYEQARMDGHDPELVLDALKAANDQDKLFEQIQKGMTFLRLLDLVKYWKETGTRPEDASMKRVVDRAVTALEKLGDITIEQGTVAPSGSIDALTFWDRRNVSDDVLRSELESSDPFVRAGALYLGAKRKLVDRERLQKAEREGSWMEKLVVHLHMPELFTNRQNEHVYWLNLGQKFNARLMGAVLPGNLEENQFFADELKKAAAATDEVSRVREGLLRILTTYQVFFQRGVIIVDESDDTTEMHALEVKDADDIEW